MARRGNARQGKVKINSKEDIYINNWEEKRKIAIVEADDFYDDWSRNGLNFLFAWKAKYPKFKITLYTIPNRTSQAMLDLLARHSEWIELAVHGWDHESNFECYGWDYDRTKMFMKRAMKEPYTKNFKAPGWTITPGFNGYPANPTDPITKDPQGVYKALTDMGYVICDRHYNKPARPENAKIICIDCNPDIIHFHTWNVPSADPNGRNGFQDIEERFGVPWTEETTFKFMSEAWQEGLYQECK